MPELTRELFEQAKKYLSNQEDFLLDDCYNLVHNIPCLPPDIHDYSFLVAPVAKAYEGFLKYFFLKIGLIDQQLYEGDRFRVGKTLNPSLRYKRFSIFQKLCEIDDSGEQLAELLWDAWKRGRNEIFHYYPGNTKKISLEEAQTRIQQVLKAIIKSGDFTHLYVK